MIAPARFLKNPIDSFIYFNLIRVKPKKLQHEITIGQIRQIVHDTTGFDPYFEVEDRYRGFVKARQLFLYFVMKYMKMSQKSAGLLVDKDHTTAYYAKKCVNKFREIEPDYLRTYNIIDSRLKLGIL